MSKLDNKTIRTAIGEKEELDYMIDRFKENKLGYINIEDLKKAREQIEKDIDEFNKEQSESCPALKEGAIIRISGGDGISYSQRDYYNIKKVGNNNIEYDLITVVHGDYGNSIKVDQKCKTKKEDWIRLYHRHYHKDSIDLKEWYEFLDYAEKVPWPTSEDDKD